VTLAPGQPRLRLFVSRSLLDRIQLQTIVPPPVGAEPRSDGAVLNFDPGGAGGITLVAQPATVGLVSHAVAAAGGLPVSFQQIVLP